MSKTITTTDEIHAHVKAKAKHERRSMKDVATEAMRDQFQLNYEENTYGSGTFG